MDFKNRVVLITGAAGNIGLETARAFAGFGALLSLVDVDEASLERAAESLGIGADRLCLTRADVAKEEDVERYVRRTLERFGRIDVFFNNAGITGNRKKIVELDTEAWQRLMDVNVRGILLGMKHVLRAMTERGGGCIINTASQAGVFSQAGGSDYCVAKGAVIHLTKIAAVEAGEYGVRVNCILPGVVDSDMMRRGASDDAYEELKSKLGEGIPLRRMAAVSDISDGVCFLASEQAGYINGAELRIDGGSSIK